MRELLAVEDPNVLVDAADEDRFRGEGEARARGFALLAQKAAAVRAS
jgi:hypothetical protein